MKRQQHKPKEKTTTYAKGKDNNISQRKNNNISQRKRQQHKPKKRQQHKPKEVLVLFLGQIHKYQLMVSQDSPLTS